MLTAHELIMEGLSKTEAMEAMLRKDNHELLERIAQLEAQLGRAHRQTAPTEGSGYRPDNECNSAMPQALKSGHRVPGGYVYFHEAGRPTPGNAIPCPCGCGVGVTVEVR